MRLSHEPPLLSLPQETCPPQPALLRRLSRGLHAGLAQTGAEGEAAKESIGAILDREIIDTHRAIAKIMLKLIREEREWRKNKPEEWERVKARFTRPDGTLCENWWESSMNPKSR